MEAARDLFENPKLVLEPDFDPRSFSVLGARIGDESQVLAGWEAEWNNARWCHVQGGVGFGLNDNLITKIKLPVSFIERLEIASPEELIQRLGKSDDIRELTYRDRLRHCGYLWSRGFIFWWELLPELKPSSLILFDPAHGYEHIGREVTYGLLPARDCLERQPSFELLPSEERESVRAGDAAKLAFDIKIGDKNFIERMWVRVTDVMPELYNGRLMNDPFCTHELKCGMAVQFHSDHIIAIQRDPPTREGGGSGGCDGRG